MTEPRRSGQVHPDVPAHHQPKSPECQTIVVSVDPRHPSDADLLPAAEMLRHGRLVAFPTETVYGLGANALDPAAIRAIFVAKGRPADNPLIVHVASLSELRGVVSRLPDMALPLIARFMPGPLTLVLPRAPHVPDAVTAGLDTVAVRMPEHPVARRLIELAGVPVAAPSANRSGRPSPTTASHVLEDMAGRIPLIVDGGPCDFGVESTVLDVTGPVPVILRPGAVTIEELRTVAGIVWTVEEAATALRHAREAARLEPVGTPKSPGMKYRHYAPRTPLRVAEGISPEDRSRRLTEMALAAIAAGAHPAVFCSDETAALLQNSLPSDWHIVNVDDTGAGDEPGRSPAPAAPPALLAVPPAPLAVPPAQSDAPPAPSDSHSVCLIAHGPRGQARTAASRLFAALRQLDACGANVIIAESADPVGIGVAYLNRLRKAAGGGLEPLDDPNVSRA